MLVSEAVSVPTFVLGGLRGSTATSDLVRCMCQNDILHWVNTATLDSCFGLVGHQQQGAECDPVESQPLNIKAYAQPLACGCKLSKITTLACAVTMTTNDHKTGEKLLPTARDSESRIVDLAARTRCVKMTSSIGSTLQLWTAVSALWAIMCHRGHCKALRRCWLVGICVRLGENFFP